MPKPPKPTTPGVNPKSTLFGAVKKMSREKRAARFQRPQPGIDYEDPDVSMEGTELKMKNKYVKALIEAGIRGPGPTARSYGRRQGPPIGGRLARETWERGAQHIAQHLRISRSRINPQAEVGVEAGMRVARKGDQNKPRSSRKTIGSGQGHTTRKMP